MRMFAIHAHSCMRLGGHVQIFEEGKLHYEPGLVPAGLRNVPEQAPIVHSKRSEHSLEQFRGTST